MLKRVLRNFTNRMNMTVLNGRDFWRDERGTIKILTVLLAAPLVMTVAAAVDTAELYRARINFQNAVDAATLSAAKTITRGGTIAEAKTQGKRVFQANLGNLAPSAGSIDFTIDPGKCASDGVVGVATLDHKLFFEFWHEDNKSSPVPGHARLNGTTTVKCGDQTVEVAMVLDNSGSMGNNGKLSTLKTSATLLVNTLHGALSASSQSQPVRFSLVPFAGFVNVGPQNKNKNWMDKKGRSSIHHENLNWGLDPDMRQRPNGVWKDSRGKTMTRFSIYDALDGVSWNGCVEQRPYPYHTQDAAPKNNNPDTLFVPAFSPDRPDEWDGYRSYYRWGGGWRSGNRVYESSYYNNWLRDNHNFPNRNDMHVYDEDHMGTGKNKQHKRQAWTWKYFDNANPDAEGAFFGPNEDCNTKPLTPLTASRTTVLNAIDDMIAMGSTNVQQGVAWGWRTLSPGKPFTNGRSSAVSNNKKIMIVMTDGNNTYYPTTWGGDQYNVSRYGAFGMSDNGRIFEGYTSSPIAHTSENFTKAMDSHLTKTCTNAKNDGVQIYSIAFDVAAGSSVKATLEGCASDDFGGGKLYYDAANAAQLKKAFQDIADKITELAITK